MLTVRLSEDESRIIIEEPGVATFELDLIDATIFFTELQRIMRNLLILDARRTLGGRADADDLPGDISQGGRYK
jgi:hypothetical protein